MLMSMVHRDDRSFFSNLVGKARRSRFFKAFEAGKRIGEVIREPRKAAPIIEGLRDFVSQVRSRPKGTIPRRIPEEPGIEREERPEIPGREEQPMTFREGVQERIERFRRKDSRINDVVRGAISFVATRTKQEARKLDRKFQEAAQRGGAKEVIKTAAVELFGGTTEIAKGFTRMVGEVGLGTGEIMLEIAKRFYLEGSFKRKALDGAIDFIDLGQKLLQEASFLDPNEQTAFSGFLNRVVGQFALPLGAAEAVTIKALPVLAKTLRGRFAAAALSEMAVTT